MSILRRCITAQAGLSRVNFLSPRPVTAYFQILQLSQSISTSCPQRYGYLHEMLLQHPIEEETMTYYNPGDYYPVSRDEVFADRYQVIGKLGYGGFSTSWLCLDRWTNRYRAVKVSVALESYPDAAKREWEALSHVKNVRETSTHPARHLIRGMEDSFVVKGPGGTTHQGLVMAPMYMTLREHIRSYPGGLLPVVEAKRVVRNLLWTLDFLHREAQVVHGDLKADNLMLTIEDGGVLSDFVQAEKEKPSDMRGNIWRTRSFRKPEAMPFSTILLCDFGDARIGTVHPPCRSAQPVIYRAPEVLFDMAWGTPADVWNLAGMVWELVQGRRLFRGVIRADGHDEFAHVARMVALIGGGPPAMFMNRGGLAGKCFDGAGNWLASQAEIPAVCLESLETRFGGGEEAEAFLDFIHSMLQWLPEQRATAENLLKHRWISHNAETHL